MITELRIENLGVIAEANVEFGPGLTVLTGETGAGKTMVLTALDLLMGGRADPSLVRTGAGGATVEGRLAPEPGSAAILRAADAGAALDEDGSLLAVRTVSSSTGAGSGRSRAYLGGRSVPQAVLAEVSESLVTVHGQSDQLRLRAPSRQRQALDEFAGPDQVALVEEHRRRWAELSRWRHELTELVARTDERRREAELLRLGLAEVERIDPQVGEDLDLTALIERLSHVEDLREMAIGAHHALVGADDQPGAEVAIHTAARLLGQGGAHDPELAEAARQVLEAGYLLSDVAAQLAAYLDSVQSDPAALDQAQQRRSALSSLTRSYGPDLDSVLRWADDAGLRLLELDAGDDRLAALRARVDALDAELVQQRRRISSSRREAARRLGELVSAELAGLAMVGARLEVQIDPTPEPGASGEDSVTMLFTAHPQAPALPLGRSASGGELSRVMLALEVTLASAGAHQPHGTFVFDEVDAGVGGRAAVQVGRRLAALATSTQVLVVTHLAQVAAYADHHLVVSRSDGVVRSADVQEATGEDRVGELARMLSGQENSLTARAHAAELLSRSDVGA